MPSLRRPQLHPLNHAPSLRPCHDAPPLPPPAQHQVAFDRYVPQLVPLLRAHAALPFDVLRAAVKLLGAMAHRASARKLMHDPASAEGLMAVRSHPDSPEP